jgi:hypothetical protein
MSFCAKNSRTRIETTGDEAGPVGLKPRLRRRKASKVGACEPARAAIIASNSSVWAPFDCFPHSRGRGLGVSKLQIKTDSVLAQFSQRFRGHDAATHATAERTMIRQDTNTDPGDML